MHFSPVTVLGLAAYVSAHGVVTSIEGANGVSMPGLTIADGTPRDCSSNGCGSQADTAIMRDREIASGEVGPLGRTQGGGPVNAATMISSFMGGAGGAGAGAAGAGAGAGAAGAGRAGAAGAGAAGAGRAGATGAATGANRGANKRGNWITRQLSALLGGLGGGAAGGAAAGQKANLPDEANVAATTGAGAASGLPTCADDGTVTMTFRQINQDGAGPMEAAIDGTSGGTEAAAFQEAQVSQDVPGLGVQGLSLATNTDFTMEVQMPAGMTCDASVGGANNVCVVRVRNGAAAGPFGGSAAFTQSATARKRAIVYRLKKRMELNRQ